MTETRPVIAITTPITAASFGVWSQDAALLPDGYVTAVGRAGGLALMVTPDPQLVEDPDELLDRIDGLIISGGADVDPASYGADPDPATQIPMPDRDTFEIALIRRAAALDMPVLGICRGMQVLNVAFGGTLIQHLPDAYGHEDHRRVPGSFDGADHDVALQDGSLVATIAGEVVHATKSHHHQGVDRVGDGLTVTGSSTLDDLAEAIELPDRRFVLGIQWHPEADEGSQMIPALVQASAEYRDARAAGNEGERAPLRSVADYRTASGSA
jgi:putative glutamine amidotransferase